MNKIKQIDFLRGLAASSVMLSHYFAWIPTTEPFLITVKSIYEKLIYWFQLPGEGHPGVICFIVLSGFCIHKPYVNMQLTSENFHRNIQIKNFYIRRFFRIFPLYWISILLGVLVFYFSLTSSIAHHVQTISATNTDDFTLSNVLQKVFVFSEFNITNFSGTYLANAPLASVVTEIWLYLFYPLFFYYLRRKGWRFIFIVTAFLYVLFPCCYMLTGTESFYNWWLFSIFNYYIIWAFGAFVSEMVFGNIKISNKKIYGLFFTTLLLYVVCYFLMRDSDYNWLKYFRMLLLSTLFGSLLHIISTPGADLSAFVFLKIFKPFYNLFCFVGNISYSIYAIHAPLLFGITVLAPFYGRWLIYFAPIFIVALSYFTYRAIEKPTHELGKRIVKNNAYCWFACALFAHFGLIFQFDNKFHGSLYQNIELSKEKNIRQLLNYGTSEKPGGCRTFSAQH